MSTITNLEELDAAFARADNAGETLTYRDHHGRDWITYGDADGYRWGWSAPVEDDPWPMPWRLDGFSDRVALPLAVFPREARS